VTPVTAEDQLQWLVDRAQISDLLIEYARCVDAADFEALTALFAEGGALVLPFARLEREQIAPGSVQALGPYWKTHHMGTNYAIEVDGDRAKSHSYLQAVHIHSESNLGAHGDLGGWYDNTYVRTEEGWRFEIVSLTFAWTSGGGFPGAGQ
jgi:SnoaL-like domain